MKMKITSYISHITIIRMAGLNIKTYIIIERKNEVNWDGWDRIKQDKAG